MTTTEAIKQAMKNVNAQYGTNMKLVPMSEYVMKGCLKRASIARRQSEKQSNSKCGLAFKKSLTTESERMMAHAEAMESYRKSGGKLD